MSWDPNQQQGQPPSEPNPYNQPPSGPNPYNSQQSVPNPYDQPSGQPGYGAPPSGYSGQPGYGTPPSGYGVPPMGQPGYGAPGFEQQGTAFAYAPQAQAPRSWGEAIQALPSQYIKVLTKPSARSFAEEQHKATWGMIWTQLIFIGLIGTIVGIIGLAVTTAALSSALGGSAGAVYGTASSLFLGTGSVYAIFSVIVGFFIIVGIQYLLAKAFGGTGTFLQQGYNYLLFYTPLAVIGYVLGLIPFLGGLIAFALAIYQIVLNVFSVMAAQRISGGKATWVVLIPIIVVFLLVVLCVVALATIFVGALHGLTTP
jgi:Yip1-like protein